MTTILETGGGTPILPHHQALNISVGCQPTCGAEVILWRASWIIREMILLAPSGMTDEETRIYYQALSRYVVSCP